MVRGVAAVSAQEWAPFVVSVLVAIPD